MRQLRNSPKKYKENQETEVAKEFLGLFGWKKNFKSEFKYLKVKHTFQFNQDFFITHAASFCDLSCLSRILCL